MVRFRAVCSATTVGLAAAAILIAGVTPGVAFPSGGHQATAHNGSSFTSACVGSGYLGFGFGQELGRDTATFGLTDGTGGAATCQAATSNGVGTVTSNAADSATNLPNLGGGFNGTSAGSAKAGEIKLQAQNTAFDTQRFTGASANGGWNDSFTVGGGTGQGLWVIPIHVSGLVNAQDPGTTSIFQVMPYIGSGTSSTPVESSTAHQGAAFGHYSTINTLQNGDVISGWSYEMSAWGAVNHGGNDPLTQLAVNEIVNLVIPITYGVAVDLGIYASVLDGERAQSAADGFSEIDFFSTVTWLGSGHVLAWDATNGIGAQNDNITVSAVSGLDYSQSFLTTVPEPATLGLFGLGLLTLGLAARRRETA